MIHAIEYETAQLFGPLNTFKFDINVNNVVLHAPTKLQVTRLHHPNCETVRYIPYIAFGLKLKMRSEHFPGDHISQPNLINHAPKQNFLITSIQRYLWQQKN